MEVKKHLDLLGFKAQDKVTSYSGVIESISFDLYGCIQAILRPTTLDKDGKVQEGRWIDVSRLKILGKKPVMDVPDFDCGIQAEGKQGPADKPQLY